MLFVVGRDIWLYPRNRAAGITFFAFVLSLFLGGFAWEAWKAKCILETAALVAPTQKQS